MGVIAFILSLLLAFHASSQSMEQEWGYYTLQNMGTTSYGWNGTLLFQQASNSTPSPYGTPLNLSLQIYYVDEYTVRVKITDLATSRWEVPNVIQIPQTSTAFVPQAYRLHYSLWYEPFYLNIERTSGETIFSSNYLYFADQYLQWGTNLEQSMSVYGLGERVWSLRMDRLQSRTFSFLTSDQGTPLKLPTYGSYPYFMSLDSRNGLAHGVFLLNSNPMDAIVDMSGVTWKTVGGVLDVFVFLGPTPQAVTEQYHHCVGKPALPPMWGLGYHQCRWGYKDYTYLQTIVNNFISYELPVDTFWVDIDYMDNFKVWTSDPVYWPTTEFGNLVNFIHNQTFHFVPIVDPGVKIETNYSVYEDGLAKGVFILDPNGTNPAVGKVWPGRVHFPDWTNPTTATYWANWTRNFWLDIPVDGLWIDMNEPASFCDGRCVVPPSEDDFYLFGCNCTADLRFDTGTLDDAPYIPVDAKMRGCRSVTNDIHGLDISTLSMASIHSNGEIEYNLHNLYGHMEGILTYDILSQLRNKRPFIISRSTYPGSSRTVGHWLGDNNSLWNDMRVSIAGLLLMSLMGNPLVGADVCGFGMNTTANLCQRWLQLGAFYPFYRNHNYELSIPQEPYAFGEAVLNSSRSILLTRYSLLPYIYTLFHQVHVSGGTVARPLFYDFPQDAATHAIDEQFLFGPAMLVSPVLEEGALSVLAYFPAGADWYDYWTGKLIVSKDAATSMRYQTLDTPLANIQVHVRSGYIIPHQVPGLTTTKQIGNPYKLLVVLNSPQTDSNIRAQGSLVVDDGDSLNTTSKGEYLELSFVATNGVGANSFSLASNVINNGYPTASYFTIQQIVIYGINCEKASVLLDGKSSDVQISNEAGVTTLTGLLLSLTSNFTISHNCESDVEPSQSNNSDDSDDTNKHLAIAGIVLGSVAIVLTIVILYRMRKTSGSGTSYLAMEPNEVAPSYQATST